MSDTILLVEPNVSDQRMVEMTLAAEFLDVVSVPDGARALEQVGSAAPALVLVDLELPDVGAASLVQQVRERAPGVRVMMLGADGDALAQIAREVGADEQLGKPFKSKDLVDRVYRLLRGGDEDSGESLLGGSASATDPFGGDGGNFDLAGALDSLGDDAAFGGAGESADSMSPIEGIENTVVMRRDDLGALRSGLGVVSPAGAPRAGGAEEAAADAGDGAGSEADGFQTMIMSRDELSALRDRAEARGPSTGPKSAPAAQPKRAPVATRPKASEAPRKPSARASAKAQSIAGEAAQATEAELLALLGGLEPAMADEVRRVSEQLVERVARRVAAEVAASRIEEEIDRVRRSLG